MGSSGDPGARQALLASCRPPFTVLKHGGHASVLLSLTTSDRHVLSSGLQSRGVPSPGAMLSALEFSSRGLQHIQRNALLLETSVSRGNLNEALRPEALPSSFRAAGPSGGAGAASTLGLTVQGSAPQKRHCFEGGPCEDIMHFPPP